MLQSKVHLFPFHADKNHSTSALVESIPRFDVSDEKRVDQIIPRLCTTQWWLYHPCFISSHKAMIWFSSNRYITSHIICHLEDQFQLKSNWLNATMYKYIRIIFQFSPWILILRSCPMGIWVQMHATRHWPFQLECVHGKFWIWIFGINRLSHCDSLNQCIPSP